MKRMSPNNSNGFTLLEMLMVVLMLGIFMAAIYTLYGTQRNTAYTQDEVIDVQQNLRIAMDSITKDIRMAGFLIPSGSTPISAGTSAGVVQNLSAPDNVNSSVLVLAEASAAHAYARVGVKTTGTSGAQTFSIDNPAGVVSDSSTGLFNQNDIVQIIRAAQKGSSSLSDLLPGGNSTFTVNSTPTTSTMTLNPGGNSGQTYIRGDVIAKTNGVYPNSITYCLGPTAGCGSGASCPTGQLCLMRIVNDGTASEETQVIAQNIAGFQLYYLIISGGTSTEVQPASGGQLSSTQLPFVRAVRAVITGKTYATTGLSGNKAKERQLSSVVYMRNN